MARTKTTVDNMDKAIKRILQKYGELTWENVDEVATKVAKKARVAITNKSKEFDTKGHWGHGVYSKGWRVKETRGLWWSSYIVHNAKRPTETHLIEYGHEVHTGVRIPRPNPNPKRETYVNTTTFRAKPQPHIAPVAAKIPDEFQAEVVDAVRRSS